jgi:site-specific DNA-cytosine methylase
VQLDPDLTTMSPPCTDYANGLGIEGEAAQVTEMAARLIVGAKLRCCLIENVVSMLSSQTWARAQALLLTHGYCLYVSKLQGSDYSIACRRRRVYVLVVRAGVGVVAAMQRYGALLNKIQRSSTPVSVRRVLRCPERFFFWKSRVKGTKRVFDANDCMPPCPQAPW